MHRWEDVAQNHCQLTPNAKWQRTRDTNCTSMHFQEAAASLSLSVRRWACKQFEITEPKGAWTKSWYRNGCNPAADLRSHLWPVYDVEKDNNQMFFDTWCEARLPNGQYIHCWLQYRQSERSRYNWVVMKFESEENNGEEPIVYPKKVLTLYKDSKGTLKSTCPLSWV
jgi:hypothetical protein